MNVNLVINVFVKMQNVSGFLICDDTLLGIVLGFSRFLS